MGLNGNSPLDLLSAFWFSQTWESKNQLYLDFITYQKTPCWFFSWYLRHHHFKNHHFLVQKIMVHIQYRHMAMSQYLLYNTIFRGMNIHLPAIFMFTRGTRFWPTAILKTNHHFLVTIRSSDPRRPCPGSNTGGWSHRLDQRKDGHSLRDGNSFDDELCERWGNFVFCGVSELCDEENFHDLIWNFWILSLCEMGYNMI